MANRIRHRGPDSTGIWVDPEAKVGLAFDRLAIVDVSAAGNQPMHSQSGRYVIVFNGEIYNHRELRKRLENERNGGSWAGHSDTETLLAAIEAWGVRMALERSVGMFALVLWDRRQRKLVLARDRIGEKPLYYGRQRAGGPLLFGSELKALAAHPDFDASVDRESLALYLRFNAVPAPRSIYRGISKLKPGSFLTVEQGEEPIIQEYWSADTVAQEAAAQRETRAPEEWVDELEHLLSRSVAGQMIADVPLGAFLSGGIDSSTVVALMQKQSPRPVRTFSIGFHEKGYDEAHHAKAVARYLGTDHTELYVTPAEAIAVLPRLPAIYDEPFADSSQIPTYLVSALARQHVTVALSGDAGDELFGGYDRYALTASLWRRMSRLPRQARVALSKVLAATPASLWNSLGDAASGALPELGKVKGAGTKIHRRAALLGSRSVMELYRGILSAWPEPGSILIDSQGPAWSPTCRTASLPGVSPTEQMMMADLTGYLPNDILVKLDRASMAVSLEARVPLLDHRVVEFAWRVPLEFKVRDGETKWILRRLLYRHVPRELIDRPKMGFGVPVGTWLKGPLRDWAECLLDERRLRQEGFFDPAPLRRMWHAHLDGSDGDSHRLWTVLMFQSWLEANRTAREPVEASRHGSDHASFPVRASLA